jgi:DNA-binding NarL/FixJ family response regulator
MYTNTLPSQGTTQYVSQGKISSQEWYVLQLATEGLSSHLIAQRMGISECTVNEYWMRARQKLHARNKVHAVAIALQRGIIQ